MINIEQRVHRAIESSGCSRPILAAPFDLPAELCRDLVARRVIGGYVADRKNASDKKDRGVAGWWVDRGSGTWNIRRSGIRELLYLGVEAEVGGRMLFAASRAGVRSFVFCDAAQDERRRAAVGEMLRARARTVLKGRTLGIATGRARQSYEQAFRDFYDDVGEHFRCPREQIEPGRALLVLGSLGPGGAERQAALTAIGLARDGRWKPMIGCTHVDGESAGFHRAAVEQAGVGVHAIPISPPMMSDPKIQKIIERSQQYHHLGFQNIAHTILSYACCFATLRPQLVQTWMDYCNVLAGIAADMVGVPALVMSGRSVAPDNFEIFQPYMRPGYLELLRRRNASFLNNSRAGASDYARWLDVPPERFTVVHNGFEFPQTRPEGKAAELKRSLGIPTGSRVVGSIFRFSEEKQPALWIDTAAKVIARSESTHCVAFGGGVMLDAMRDRVADRGLADRIKLPGVTDDAWSVLTMMDVFLLTSRMEGLPNVVIEAQAMGVPVVTTGQGGMLETYRDGVTGITGPVDDADSLAAHIIDLLDCPERTRVVISEEASRFARHEFNVSRLIERTLDVFDTAMHTQTKEIG